jgi:guanine deaminase
VTPDEFMEEACRLAKESVDNGWGGPFGAVIVKDGDIVARGQNRVLLTGDITAHAEVETIRKAVAALNPEAPTIAPDRRKESTLELIPRPEGSPDPVPERAKMLVGLCTTSHPGRSSWTSTTGTARSCTPPVSGRWTRATTR